jgi:hypothetical protein
VVRLCANRENVDSTAGSLSLHNQVKSLNEQRELRKLCELKSEMGELAPNDEKRYEKTTGTYRAENLPICHSGN